MTFVLLPAVNLSPSCCVAWVDKVQPLPEVELEMLLCDLEVPEESERESPWVSAWPSPLLMFAKALAKACASACNTHRGPEEGVRQCRGY